MSDPSADPRRAVPGTPARRSRTSRITGLFFTTAFALSMAGATGTAVRASTPAHASTSRIVVADSINTACCLPK